MSSVYEAVLTGNFTEDLNLQGYALAFVKPRVLTLIWCWWHQQIFCSHSWVRFCTVSSK